MHSTFSDNAAGFSGGAFFAGTQQITLTNTLVANNTAGNPWNINLQTNRQFRDGGGNLQYPPPQTTDPQDVTVVAGIRIANPELLPLGNYGGLTLVHGLAQTSAALNQGVSSPLATDQRGVQRDRQPDIGAYEWSLQAPIQPIIFEPKPSSGDDTLNGTRNSDVIRGFGGSDVMQGFGGNDRLFGDSGHDTLIGGTGHDRLTDGTGRDHLWGQAGNDTLLGGQGNDRLVGDGGRDRLIGQGGNDHLSAGASHDYLSGGVGSDRLFGGAGRDTLFGNGGHDTLFGGDGNDVISTGAGRDRIILQAGAGYDRVLDFRNNHDKIQLVGLRFGQLTLRQHHDDVLIQFNGKTLLLLENTHSQLINAADFIEP